MPHYSDGTEVKVGDVAKGKGYNFKGRGKDLVEIVGTVIGVTPDSASCNIQIAHVVPVAIPASFDMPDYRLFEKKGVFGCGPDGGKPGTERTAAIVCHEYGQCDHFELVHRDVPAEKAEPAVA